MTRGQIVIFHAEGITASTEFNGNMYFSPDELGYGMEVVEALKDIHLREDYEKFVNAFNKEHFQYEEQLFYNPLTDGITKYTEMQILDMTEGYFDKWFSDYLYFKNLRQDEVELVARDGYMLTIESGGILALNVGKYNDECVEHSTGIRVGISDKYIDICENHGWTVHIFNDDIELEQFSPAGEDFSFTVSVLNFVKEVERYAEDFDPDEHAEMWIESRGTRGVPSSVRDLIDDADGINEMLHELATALKTEAGEGK